MLIRKALKRKGIHCSDLHFQYALAVATVDIKANNIRLGKRTNFNAVVDLVEKSVKIVQKYDWR